MPGDRLIEALRLRPVLSLGESLGLAAGRGALGPCPACGATRRGRQDRRAPIGVYQAGTRWKCNACQAGGDGIDLLAWALCGRGVAQMSREDWSKIRAWDGADLPPRTAAPVPAAPRWPPHGEVRRVWDALTRIWGDEPQAEEARLWLQLRKIDPARVEALDLARVRTATAEGLPEWVPGWPWGLALPLVDCTGQIRSLRWRAPRGASVGRVPLRERYRSAATGTGMEAARARVLLADARVVRVLEDAPRPKSRTPTGFEAAGLVMACPVARAIWGRTGEVPPMIGMPEGAGVAWDGRVLLVEGDMDFLTWAAHPGRAGAAGRYAVIGYTSGAWTPAHAARLPAGCTVLLRHQGDAAGLAYERTIRATLPGSVQVRTMAGTGGDDEGQG